MLYNDIIDIIKNSFILKTCKIIQGKMKSFIFIFRVSILIFFK
jgi:hypothetical protein